MLYGGLLNWLLIEFKFQSILMHSDEIRAAVVDIGSSVCRLGAAGNDMPRYIYRSVRLLYKIVIL